MKVSVRKISELTGFSPATVSNALNYKKGVNAETASKILKIAQDMGYFDENHIRKVKFVTVKNSGRIVEDTPFFPMVITGVEEACRAAGMEMQMVNLDMNNSNFEEQAHWMQNDKSAAVILLGTELMDEDIDLIRNMDVPFVVIDYWNRNVPFNAVLINNLDSAHLAVSYLISKGHKEIGYLQGNVRIKPFRFRAGGYQNAMRGARLPVHNNYIVTLSVDMDGAYTDMKAYLAKKPKLPTAFFADNDMIALGAMRAMQEEGIRIPEDVSIIGFDDLTFSSIVNPPLTTIRVPKKEIGRAAMMRILDILKNGNEVKLKTEVCTQFIERDSVRDLRGASKN